MLVLLLPLLLAPAFGGLPARQEGPPEPKAEEVAAALADLDQAYRSGELKLIQTALEAASRVPHANVVRRLLTGLEDERAEVRLAVIEALRWQPHADALTALERLAKDQKRMRDPAQAAAVLRGLGQHADPRSVALLARTPFEPPDQVCLRARVLALGRIRTRESLETLMQMLGAIQPGARDGRRRIQPVMGDARLSLMLLSGVDRGLSPEQWEDWWRTSRKDFELPGEAPLLPRELRLGWERYWGLPPTYERGSRREDRGSDGPVREPE